MTDSSRGNQGGQTGSAKRKWTAADPTACRRLCGRDASDLRIGIVPSLPCR